MKVDTISNEEMGIAARLPGVQSAIDQLLAYKQSLLDELAAVRGRKTADPIETLTGTTEAADTRFQWGPVLVRALSQGPMNQYSLQMAIDPHLPVSLRPAANLRSALTRLTRTGVLIRKGDQYSVGKRKPGGYWDNMTAEQRSAEMTRRVNLRQPTVKLHPRDVNHPGHDAWVQKMRDVSRLKWAKMSKAERKRRQDAMKAGHKQKVNGAEVSA